MTTNHDLAEQIEQLVRKHIETTRAAVAAAVERAFAPTARAAGDAPRSRAAGAVRARASAAARRPAEEVLALAEQFYAVLCRNPGETMTMLAPQVGASPRALQVAVARLKSAARVRTVGERQYTRYFPMTNTSKVPAVAA